MVNQDVFNDLFALWLSGAAKMKNDKEIEYVDDCLGHITVEFYALCPSAAIVRGFESNDSTQGLVMAFDGGGSLMMRDLGDAALNIQYPLNIRK